jgi:hypothetical protein
VLANSLQGILLAIPAIGATAFAEGIPLVKKDTRILAFKQIKTIW